MCYRGVLFSQYSILNTLYSTLKLFLSGEFHRLALAETKTDPEGHKSALLPVISEIIGRLLGYALEIPGGEHVPNTQVQHGLALQNFLSCPEIHKNILGNLLLYGTVPGTVIARQFDIDIRWQLNFSRKTGRPAVALKIEGHILEHSLPHK